MYKMLKKSVAALLIICVAWVNISVDFSALFSKSSLDSQVINLGSESWAAINTWTKMSDLIISRLQHAQSTLLDGRVLLTGGHSSQSITSWSNAAIIYNPITDTWSGDSALLPDIRIEHAQSTLLDGRVLVTGGTTLDRKGNSQLTNTAWIYNPATISWSSAAAMPGYASGHSQSTLLDGRVLVVGVCDNNKNLINVAWIYDPTTDTWTNTATMPEYRRGCSQSTLLDGRVLVTGGTKNSEDTKTTLIYNPVANTWSNAAPMAEYRSNHAQSTLLDGKVLVTGGDNSPLASLYNPATNTWTNAANMPVSRGSHAQSILLDGRLLLTGGGGPDTPFAYTVNVYTYSYNDPPTIAVTTPAPNEIFSSMAGKNLLSLSGTINDSGVGDIETVCYRFDGSAGQAGIQYGNTITSNGTNQAFPQPPQSINVGTLSDGNHTLYVWVQDNKGGRSAETAIPFRMDKTPPSVNVPVLTANSYSQITVQPNAADPAPNGVSSGLHAIPYLYNKNGTDNSWQAGSFVDMGLTPNTQYTYKYKARDNVLNESGYSAVASKYTLAQVPSLSISNVKSYSMDIIAFDNNPLSTQYQISTSDGKYVSPEGILTSSPVWITLADRGNGTKEINVSGLSSATPYTFLSKARNAESIETVLSSPVSGTTLIPPPVAPVNLTAIATSNSITVNWDGVVGATGYDVMTDDTNIMNNGTRTTYIHNGLNPGTQHKYKIRARNEGGTGDWSAELTKLTLPSSPGIPANLSATPASNSVIVTWTPVPGATGYDVKIDGDLEINGPSTNYVHTGLIPGTYHAYKVRSINPGGKSEWSTEVGVTTLLDIPLVPANITAVPSQTQISLTWNPVNGASYEVEADGTLIDNSDRTTYTHMGLTPNTQHIYRIRAKKTGITSDWSAALTVSTLNNVFGTPVNVKGSATDTSVTLTWNAVTDATGYDIEIDGVPIDNGFNTFCTHNGLEPGSSHTYRIRAKQGDAASEWSQPLAVTTYLVGTPQNISASATDTSITAVWQSVYEAINYDVEMDGILIGMTPDTSYTKDGLYPNSQHAFRIRAVNSQGSIGGWSNPIAFSTLFNGTSVPSSLTGVARNTSITLLWNPVAGSTAYDLEIDGALVPDVTGTSYLHNSLTPSSQHTYKVRAKTASESGRWTNLLTVATLPVMPQVPTNITASSTTSSITVSWDSVPNAAGYDIEADGVVIDKGMGTSYLHTGLASSTSHTYRVRARNTAGNGEWSAPVTLDTKDSTTSYTVNSTVGEVFSILVTASDLTNPSNHTYTITYNPEELEVVDLCASTIRADLSTGMVMGSDITITQFTPGTVVFTKTVGAQPGQSWSGMVNSVKFKAKIEGQSTVTYSIN